MTKMARKKQPTTSPNSDGLDIPDFLRRKPGDKQDTTALSGAVVTQSGGNKRRSFDIPRGYTEEEYLAVKEFLALPPRQKELRRAANAVDRSNQRWDARSCVWVPLENENHDMASRWKIVPYDATGAIIQRGVTSVPEGTEQIQLLARMGAAFARCAKGSVAKIIVHNNAGEGEAAVVREWVAETDSPLPEPAKEEAAEKPAGDAPAKKGKAATKPAKAAGKKANGAAKGGAGKGPGVISTVRDMISAKGGASVEEIHKALVKKFPDRAADGMLTTVKIQVKRLGGVKSDHKTRGVVWSLSK